MSTPKAQLVLNMQARFEWLDQPENKADEIMRERADILASEALSRIEPAIKVLVMELLNTNVPSNA